MLFPVRLLLFFFKLLLGAKSAGRLVDSLDLVAIWVVAGLATHVWFATATVCDDDLAHVGWLWKLDMAANVYSGWECLLIWFQFVALEDIKYKFRSLTEDWILSRDIRMLLADRRVSDGAPFCQLDEADIPRDQFRIEVADRATFADCQLPRHWNLARYWHFPRVTASAGGSWKEVVDSSWPFAWRVDVTTSNDSTACFSNGLRFMPAEMSMTMSLTCWVPMPRREGKSPALANNEVTSNRRQRDS
ncbi:hypothetical protein F5Y12DRAFT_791432 [Xylaria sp. FL1777]|nr:hypothetical protein F5Y12DRAFT_791432 [Xylaria sp. FL1777]